jgi:preprotein translocase subunit YajC
MNNMWILAAAEPNKQEKQTFDLQAVPVNVKQLETKTIAPADSNTIAGIGQKPTSFSFLGQYGNLIFIGLMFVVFYFILFRGPRKKEQEHRQMVQGLQKNDKVRTIGGIIGTVVDIKDDEVTLKIDESNNTKIKIISSAIGKKLS